MKIYSNTKLAAIYLLLLMLLLQSCSKTEIAQSKPISPVVYLPDAVVNTNVTLLIDDIDKVNDVTQYNYNNAITNPDSLSFEMEKINITIHHLKLFFVKSGGTWYSIPKYIISTNADGNYIWTSTPNSAFNGVYQCEFNTINTIGLSPTNTAKVTKITSGTDTWSAMKMIIIPLTNNNTIKLGNPSLIVNNYSKVKAAFNLP
jgi:hypothetical protein